MALRAGYFGLKRFEKNKLSVLAASMPADIGPDNPIASKSDISATVDLLKDTTGWVGKNRFNGKATSKTDQYGVTWTVDANDNNVFTVSGTPTGFESFTIDSKKVLPVGKYVLSGISDMVNVVYNAVFLFKSGTQVRDLQIRDNNFPRTFSILQSDDYDTIRVQLKRQTNGVSCSGTGKIMITTPEEYALSPTYEPYHGSVEEMLKYYNVRLQDVPNEGTIYDKVVNVANQLDTLVTDIGVKFSGYVLWTQSMFLRVEAIRCNATTLLYTIFNVSYTIYNGAVQNGTVTVYKIEGTEITPPAPTPENETKKVTKKKVIKEEEE